MAQNFPPVPHGPGVTIVIHRGQPPDPNQMWDHAASRLDAVNGPGKKKAKGDVHYRKGSDDRNCEECVHSTFAKGETTGICDVVAGPIEVSMVSDLFKAESAQQERSEGEGPEPEPDAKGPPPPQQK